MRCSGVLTRGCPLFACLSLRTATPFVSDMLVDFSNAVRGTSLFLQTDQAQRVAVLSSREDGKEQYGLPPPRAILYCILYGMFPQVPVLLAPCIALPSSLLSFPPAKSYPAKLCFSSLPYLSPVLPHLDRLLARMFQVWQRHYHPKTELQFCALPW